MKPIFRFAPSPNGLLHLGHAYSALLNARMAGEADGRFLLRIEDIDTARCAPELEHHLIEDLRWLGLEWEEPVRRQSEHFADYQAALDTLIEAGLVYPAFMSRGEVRARIDEWTRDGREWPHDPDGTPHYPTDERTMPAAERRLRIAAGEPFAWRLDVEKAMARYGRDLYWDETGAGPAGETGRIAADPSRWGDVVIARKETPTSYHLSVVIDDALQGATHVVRGRDLFHATAVHRLLQDILGLPVPLYHHHDLILGEDGRKLSKSRGDTALRSLREAGMQPEDIRRLVGL
ncbi:tRNA glutamyl-Q(34) synthetase GluQRS [Phyllobacterium leguminum]|uniref:Glutamyl-Q tRNA(Asp) synthetase n=1 Tax=Phyllobacterium leguminum TaxID=314237 RepID=A0A318T2A2_9HYPH|nr:tRNA glutamyl-Q(34) synthetase GluQRS [Phyllobacterium leguminum]PYE88749.1 glutamyl-Q tRNA(Asp) synthetase [Phyllobacterium leguminum]